MSATIVRSVVDREPLLEHERGRQAERPGPIMARSLTVPCTARWPIEPPGNRSGLHDERVGAERQPLARRQLEHAPRRSGRQRRRRRTREEHGVEQGGRRLAARAVGERDDVVEQARLAAAERFDALEHRCLAAAHGRRSLDRRSGTCALLRRASRCTIDHSSRTSAACASWMRWTLSDGTTRQ